MTTRITTAMLQNNLLESLNQSQQTESNALNQVETGMAVNLPSDNPAIAATYAAGQSQNASLTQYLQNITTLSGGMQTASSALNSAVTALNQAVSLGTEGASSDVSAAQRESLAQGIAGIQQQMLNVANTTYQGQYLFAGTNTGQPAFVADASQPGGVAYQGTSGVNQVEVAPGSTIATGVPGSQLFDNPNGSVFQALNRLQTALSNNDTSGIQSAVSGLNSALGQLSQQQEYYGSAVANLNATQTQLTGQQTGLDQQQTTLISANMASAISALSTDQQSLQAILDAGALLNSTNLLSLLGTNTVG